MAKHAPQSALSQKESYMKICWQVCVQATHTHAFIATCKRNTHLYAHMAWWQRSDFFHSKIVYVWQEMAHTADRLQWTSTSMPWSFLYFFSNLSLNFHLIFTAIISKRDHKNCFVFFFKLVWSWNAKALLAVTRNMLIWEILPSELDILSDSMSYIYTHTHINNLAKS